MSSKALTIPAWYSNDWAPAHGHGELPPISWEAVEAVIDDLLGTTSRLPMARMMFRTLWLESARLAPMDLLQQFLVTAATTLDPARSRTALSDSPSIMNPATGQMPRWSYTDVEVAISYTWQGLPLTIATQRHRDLLSHRGERISTTATTRQLLLLVSGLPSPAMPVAKTSRAVREDARQAAA